MTLDVKRGEAMDEKNITPVIKKTRSMVEKYEVCPHCMMEIMEKSTFCDKNNLIYHRPCMDKGPIDKLVPARLEWSEQDKCFKVAEYKSVAKTIMKWAGNKFIKTPAIGVDVVIRMAANKDTLHRMSFPAGSADAKLFIQVVNQGIDSHMEAFTKSLFNWVDNRLVADVHESEIPILLRRLREVADAEENENAALLAGDIESVLREEKEEGQQLEQQKEIRNVVDRITQRPSDSDILDFGHSGASIKTAEFPTTTAVEGIIQEHVAGKNYSLRYVAHLGVNGSTSADSVEIRKPNDMPDYIWQENFATFKEQAAKLARVELSRRRGG